MSETDPPVEGDILEEATNNENAQATTEGPPEEQAENDQQEKSDGKSEIAKRIERDPLELSFLVKLPEEVKFNDIPKINDAKGIWRLGMRKIEETFAEHIANMHIDFEDKVVTYANIQNKIEKNLAFLENFYVEMQKLLNEKYASIKIERDEWELEKEEIRKLVRYESEIVKLNIGGTHHIQTEKDVLRSVPGSLLAKLFSDMHELKKVDEEVFIDRDGKTFETLVNYLRNDRKVFPEFTERNAENHFIKELHYWNVDKHVRLWQETFLKKLDKSTLQIDSNNISMNASLLSSPRDKKDDESEKKVKEFQPTKYPIKDENTSQGGLSQQRDSWSSAGSEAEYDEDEDQAGAALKAVKEKWTELGPLKLEDIIANSDDSIDQTLEFGQSRNNKFIIGQIGPDGKCQGVGKEINHIIYEGQFKNDIYHGYGRYIYANGNFYIGNWRDGKRSGWGKLVDKSGKVYEGMWKLSKFIGNQ